jgi:hypothetical protein
MPKRHGHQHAQRQRRRGRERAGRRLIAGNDGGQAGRGDKQKQGAEKAEIGRGSRRPTSSICCSMPVTRISSRFCQRERVRSLDSLAVMSSEPTTSTSISAQVKTMVALSLRTRIARR